MERPIPADLWDGRFVVSLLSSPEVSGLHLGATIRSMDDGQGSGTSKSLWCGEVVPTGTPLGGGNAQVPT